MLSGLVCPFFVHDRVGGVELAYLVCSLSVFFKAYWHTLFQLKDRNVVHYDLNPQTIQNFYKRGVAPDCAQHIDCGKGR